MTFDEALGTLLALNSRRIEVSVHDAGDVPHLVASFAGVLRGAYSMAGGEPSPQEAVWVRLQTGDEVASIILDRELFTAGQEHDDGAISMHFGATELTLSPRELPGT